MTHAKSFAASHADLPGDANAFEASAPNVSADFDRNRDPSIAAQLRDADKTEAERRGSQMVKEDRPRPAPRPSPSLALGPDSSAFQARWEGEKESAARAARKAEFKAERQAQAPSRACTHNRHR